MDIVDIVDLVEILSYVVLKLKDNRFKILIDSKWYYESVFYKF